MNSCCPYLKETKILNPNIPDEHICNSKQHLTKPKGAIQEEDSTSPLSGVISGSHSKFDFQIPIDLTLPGPKHQRVRYLEVRRGQTPIYNITKRN